jgi:hypothetical protein
VTVTVSSIPFANFSATQKLWLVKGIGIVKTNSAAVQTQITSLPGSERQMKGHGTRTINAVRSKSPSVFELSISPNPLKTTLSIELRGATDGKGIEKIVLAGVTGNELLTLYEGAPQTHIELTRPPVASGAYFLLITSAGTTRAEKIVIQ